MRQCPERGNEGKKSFGLTRNVVGDVDLEVRQHLGRGFPKVGARESIVPARDDGSQARASKAQAENHGRSEPHRVGVAQEQGR